MKSAPLARLAKIVLACAAISAIALIGGGGLIVDYALRVVPIPQLLVSRHDDRTYLAARLSRIPRLHDAKSGQTQINVLGASAVRESFISADAALSSAISARLGRPVTMNTLGSTDQNLRETLVLVDNAATAADCFNFVGISPLRFRFPEEAPIRIPLRSTALARFDRERGSSWRLGKSLASHYHWPWLSRWLTWRFAEDRVENVAYVATRHLLPRTLPKKIMEREWRKLAAKTPGILRHMPLNMGLLENIIETSRSRGCKTVLFEQVHHPVIVALQRPIESTYRAYLTRVLKKYHVSYVNYRDHIELEGSHFADHLHLSIAGKKLVEEWFVNQIVDSDIMRSVHDGAFYKS